MTDATNPDADAGGHVADDEEHGHRGTFILMLMFLGVIAAMWIWAYFTLLSRS